MEEVRNINANKLYPRPSKLRWTQDHIHKYILNFLCFLILVFIITIITMLFIQSIPAVKEYGMSFVTGTFWNPIEDEFGAAPFIIGTLISSFLALALSAPVSIVLALYISQTKNRFIAKTVGLLIEMIASIPSIVFGLWGIFYLAPFVKDYLTPLLKFLFGFSSWFQGPSFGIGILTSVLILAFMITPTITSLCKEIFSSIPHIQKEAALGLGATKYEMTKISILRPSKSGIIGAVILGLGRALGETMAVAMVIGNQPSIPKTIFSPAATLASVIANEYAEAESDIHLSALCLIGIILFAITLIANIIAQLFVLKRREIK